MKKILLILIVLAIFTFFGCDLFQASIPVVSISATATEIAKDADEYFYEITIQPDINAVSDSNGVIVYRIFSTLTDGGLYSELRVEDGVLSGAVGAAESPLITTNNTFYVNNQWTTSASGFQEIATLTIDAIWVPYNSTESHYTFTNSGTLAESLTELEPYYYLSETSVVIAPIKP